MSSGYVRADTDGIRAAAAQFDAIDKRLSELDKKLQSNLDAIGNCWGDDSSGKTFEGNYLPARDQILKGLTGTGTAFRDTRDQLKKWADDYEKVEESNTSIAKKLQGGQ